MQPKFLSVFCLASVVICAGCGGSDEDLGAVLNYMPNVPGTETRYQLPPRLIPSAKKSEEEQTEGGQPTLEPGIVAPAAEENSPTGREPADATPRRVEDEFPPLDVPSKSPQEGLEAPATSDPASATADGQPPEPDIE